MEQFLRKKICLFRCVAARSNWSIVKSWPLWLHPTNTNRNLRTASGQWSLGFAEKWTQSFTNRNVRESISQFWARLAILASFTTTSATRHFEPMLGSPDYQSSFTTQSLFTIKSSSFFESKLTVELWWIKWSLHKGRPWWEGQNCVRDF